MFSFKGFLTKDKNTHLEHLEDDIINRGAVGGENAINFLKAVRNMLAGSGKGTNMTVKWDGAPAVFAGEDPSDGQFFVAKKGIFNKNPKVYKSESEIDVGGELGEKFKIAFRNFKDLGIKGVIQGDFLFSKQELKKKKIDGQNYIVLSLIHI